jgi:hypothetical protein
VAKPDIAGLLQRLQEQADKPRSGVAHGHVEDVCPRLKAYFEKLETLIPEPPHGWMKKALPPGSAPRTGGKPSA